MIHGKSTDKVQIKKIDVRLWTLSDEIEANILHYKDLLNHQENQSDENLIERFKQLKAFYECQPISPLKPKPVESKPHLSLVKSLPTSSDPVPNNPEPLTAAAADPMITAPEATDQENVPQNIPQDVTQGEITPSEQIDPIQTQNINPEKVASIEENANVITPVETPKVVPPTLAVLPPINHLEIRKNTPRLIPVSNKISNGFAILYDISFENILLFSNKNFLPGQHVMIEFLVPRSFAIVGEIIYTKVQGSSSRIISTQTAPYRLKIHFLHQHLGDTSLLRNFLKSVDHRIT